MNFSKAIKNGFETFKDIVYKEYKGDPAKIMVHTGTIGWMLSSSAQLWNVATSDKFTPDEKKFLFPQEALDALVNIGLFYTVTNSCKKLSSKLVSSGKLLSKPIREYIKKNPVSGCDLNKFGTNLAESYKPHSDFFKIYQPFKNGVDMTINTVACIVASNLITPFVRNKIAAARQKQAISQEKMDLMAIHKPILPAQNRFGIDDFKKQASLRAPSISSGGSMRI